MKTPTLTLDTLSDYELRLYNEVALISGDIDYKMQQIKDKGIFEQYNDIHKSYFDLLISSTDEYIKLEALKRTCFLNWYFILEPSWLTGINQLDGDIIYNSYEVLNDYIKRNKIDHELKNMLTYSSQWNQLIFAVIEDELPELKSLLNAVDPKLLKKSEAELIKAEMQNRGQMGLYFKSMAEVWKKHQ